MRDGYGATGLPQFEFGAIKIAVGFLFKLSRTQAKSAPFGFSELAERKSGIAKHVDVKSRQTEMWIGRARQVRCRHLKFGFTALGVGKLRILDQVKVAVAQRQSCRASPYPRDRV